MAGRQNRKEVNHDLLQEIAELKAQVLDLQQKLAIHAPDIALEGQPDETTEYSEQILKQIMALGELGLTENEMIAAINVRREAWNEWKERFPEMTAALLRARDMALAAIDRMSRESLANRDWRFPFQNVERTKKVLMDQGSNTGDGASLVKVLRGYACPVCNKPKAPSVSQSVADTAG